MSRQRILLLVIASTLSGSGCSLRERGMTFDADLVHYKQHMAGTEFRDVDQMTAEVPAVSPPHSIRDTSEPGNWWDLRLNEAIQIAIDRSPVMRDLGGAYVRSPATVRTVHAPSIEASDPRNGMEAALSAFDASLRSSLTYEHNRRWMNNFLSSGGVSPLEGLRQDYAQFQTQLTKQAATGTQMTIRGFVIYDSNNQAANKFPYTYDSIVEAEVRQPVLQGAGLDFNRIAGPEATLGGTSGLIYNGIAVARLNTDVSLIDFRIGIRDVVSNVENAYWDLYFAYRDLHAKIEARNRCLEAWRAIYGMMLAGQPGGEAEREAQFRGQYYRFEEEVKNALTGQLLDRTTTFNGSSGGTFRGVSGVQVAERRLRLVLGLDINDGRLIRPADEPTLARVEFDWDQLVADSITRREELHRQRLSVRRRELEATASRNFLLPRFDVFGRYRARGMGENWGNGADPAKIAFDDPEFLRNSSLANLFGGTFQEYMVGGEFYYPLGFRRAHAAVRNAQLLLAREHAVLREQERQILHDLSNAQADVQRAYEILQTSYNGRLAAKEQVHGLRSKLKRGLPVNLDQLIDAERRFSETESQYHRALAEYMIALKNVHFEKGTLLEYSNVELAESPDATLCSLLSARRTDMPSRAELLDYTLSRPLSSDSGSSPEKLEPARNPLPEPAGSVVPPAQPAAPAVPGADPAPQDNPFSDDLSETTRPPEPPADVEGQVGPPAPPFIRLAPQFYVDPFGSGETSATTDLSPTTDLSEMTRPPETPADAGGQLRSLAPPLVRLAPPFYVDVFGTGATSAKTDPSGTTRRPEDSADAGGQLRSAAPPFARPASPFHAVSFGNGPPSVATSSGITLSESEDVVHPAALPSAVLAFPALGNRGAEEASPDAALAPRPPKRDPSGPTANAGPSERPIRNSG